MVLILVNLGRLCLWQCQYQRNDLNIPKTFRNISMNFVLALQIAFNSKAVMTMSISFCRRGNWGLSSDPALDDLVIIFFKLFLLSRTAQQVTLPVIKSVIFWFQRLQSTAEQLNFSLKTHVSFLTINQTVEDTVVWSTRRRRQQKKTLFLKQTKQQTARQKAGGETHCDHSYISDLVTLWHSWLFLTNWKLTLTQPQPQLIRTDSQRVTWTAIAR